MGEQPKWPRPATIGAIRSRLRLPGQPAAPWDRCRALCWRPQAAGHRQRPSPCGHLLLAAGGGAGFAPCAKLLVVTFTEVAAAELKDRIGRRLEQALLRLEPACGEAAPSGDGVTRANGWTTGRDGPGSEQLTKTNCGPAC